ncbi:MAG: hypothetical protein PHH26_01950 [Candidatus Thermoplasmatota archaeon]|nr:hypothetical protein [Candidatus Thermoplasmatota archaeon]
MKLGSLSVRQMRYLVLGVVAVVAFASISIAANTHSNAGATEVTESKDTLKQKHVYLEIPVSVASVSWREYTQTIGAKKVSIIPPALDAESWKTTKTDHTDYQRRTVYADVVVYYPDGAVSQTYHAVYTCGSGKTGNYVVIADLPQHGFGKYAVKITYINYVPEGWFGAAAKTMSYDTSFVLDRGGII